MLQHSLCVFHNHSLTHNWALLYFTCLKTTENIKMNLRENRLWDIRKFGHTELTIPLPNLPQVWYVSAYGVIYDETWCRLCTKTVGHACLRPQLKKVRCCDYGQYKHNELYSKCVQNRPHTCQKLTQYDSVPWTI